MNTQKAMSRSRSAAAPLSTMWPRASARAATSAKQSRLADPGGAHDLDGARGAGRQRVKGVVEPSELVLAAYEACQRSRR